jgi:hypothetical protein
MSASSHQPFAKTSSLIARRAEIASVPFWVAGSIECCKMGFLTDGMRSSFDAMTNETRCAFAVSSDGCVVCNVGMEIEESERSSFLCMWLSKNYESMEYEAVLHRPADSMPDVRVFHDDVFSGIRKQKRLLMLRGSTTRVPLGGMKTISIEGSILLNSVVKMRFMCIPPFAYTDNQYMIEGGRTSLQIRRIEPMVRMGDLQHFAIERMMRALSDVDRANVDYAVSSMTSAVRVIASYCMSNEIVASSTGIEYFTRGRISSKCASDIIRSDCDMRGDAVQKFAVVAYSNLLADICHEAPPITMTVEPVDSPLSHAMDVIHCPTNKSDGDIPWDILATHKSMLECGASKGSLSAIGLLMSIEVRRQLRCFPRGIVYHHTLVSHDEESCHLNMLVAIVIHRALHENGKWALPLIIGISATLRANAHVPKRLRTRFTVDVIACAPGDPTERDVYCEHFSPVPVSCTAYIIALLAKNVAPACGTLPVVVEPLCDGDPLSQVTLKMMSSDEVRTYDSRTFGVHSSWLDVLRLPMSHWDNGTANLILASSGFCYNMSMTTPMGSGDIQYVEMRTLVVKRTGTYQFVMLCPEEEISENDRDDTIAITLCPWLYRGMLHISPNVVDQILRGYGGGPFDPTCADAQIYLFTSLDQVVRDMLGNARMIKVDIPINVHPSALDALCLLLANPLLICFQSRFFTFPIEMYSTLTYATISTACAHLLHVNLGSHVMTVNVKPKARPPSSVSSSLEAHLQTLRDVSIFGIHLTPQERAQDPVKSFLLACTHFIDPTGIATYDHLWTNERAFIQ